MAAHPSPRRAVRKAVLEQGHVGPYLHRLMIDAAKPVPETPDDVHTLDDHARYYFPPSRSGALAFLGERGSIALADLPEPADASPAWIAGRLRAAGLRAAIVDLTSRDLDRTPFRVARAVGPDFQPIHFGHGVARLGNPRLVALAPEGPNPDPHPMA
jgi:ribosomal protein S12 methylthiotransferase accessory factor